MAVNCLVLRKSRFVFGDRQTDGQTDRQTDEQMNSTAALSRYRERRLNNSIRHVENRFSPNFIFNAVWALTSGGFRIVSDTLVCLFVCLSVAKCKKRDFLKS